MENFGHFGPLIQAFLLDVFPALEVSGFAGNLSFLIFFLEF